MPGDPASTAAQGQQVVLVLVVEDEEPIAEVLAELIEEAGYAVVRASHGGEGLELARKHHLALIITDLMMPYLNGRALIQAVREEAQARGEPPPPIILMSAAGRAQIANVPADAVMHKPFDLAEVDRLLRRFLGSPREASTRD